VWAGHFGEGDLARPARDSVIDAVRVDSWSPAAHLAARNRDHKEHQHG